MSEQVLVPVASSLRDFHRPEFSFMPSVSMEIQYGDAKPMS
jgi:hypothetical protein